MVPNDGVNGGLCGLFITGRLQPFLHLLDYLMLLVSAWHQEECVRFTFHPVIFKPSADQVEVLYLTLCYAVNPVF